MTLLNAADALYIGSFSADRAYLAGTQVWPAGIYAQFESASAINVMLSNGNLTVINNASGTTNQGARVATASGETTGKFYYEATLVDWATSGSIGIGGIAVTTTTYSVLQANGTGGVMLQSSGGSIWTNGTVPYSIGTRANGDVLGFAIDLDNRRFWCRVAPSGYWNNNLTADPATNINGITIPSGTMVPFCTFGGASTGPFNNVTTNFGLTGFTGTVPTGFTAGWLA